MDAVTLKLAGTAPAAPASFSVTASNTTSISISWADTSDETGYKIWWNTTGSDPTSGTPNTTAAANATSVTASSLSSNTQYYFWITASNVYGESSALTGNGWTTEGGSGGNLIPNADFAGDSTTGWTFTGTYADTLTASSGVATATTTGSGGDTDAVLKSPVCDANLASGTTYVMTIELRSDTSTGNAYLKPYQGATGYLNGYFEQAISTSWQTWSATFDYAGEATVGLAVLLGQAGAGDIEVRNLLLGFLWVIITVMLACSPGSRDRVNVLDPLNENYVGETGGEVTVTNYHPLAPAAPTGLTLDGTTISNLLSITWTDAATNEEGYRIYRSTTSTKPSSADVTLSAGIESNAMSATPGQTYYVWVESFNGYGARSASDSVTMYSAANPPAAPTGFNVTASNTTSIDISWTDVANETGYKIWWNTTGTDPTSGAANATKSADTTTCTASSLTANTRYYFWIKAYNANGDSSALTGNHYTAPSGGGSLSGEVIYEDSVEGLWVGYFEQISEATAQEYPSTGGKMWLEINESYTGSETYNSTSVNVNFGANPTPGDGAFGLPMKYFYDGIGEDVNTSFNVTGNGYTTLHIRMKSLNQNGLFQVVFVDSEHNTSTTVNKTVNSTYQDITFDVTSSATFTVNNCDFTKLELVQLNFLAGDIDTIWFTSASECYFDEIYFD